MSRTQTIFIDLQRLRSTGDSALIIIKLMMALNDLMLANQCVKEFKKEKSPIRKHVQKGASMYFVRLQIGHLREALKIVQEIKNNNILNDLMERCSQDAKDAFHRLADCLKGGTEHGKFEQYVSRIRHSTVFHYDNGKLIDKVLKEGKRSKITFGDDITLSRFDLADEIISGIVCKQICGVNSQTEIDDIMCWGFDIAKSLIDFSGEFIYKFIQEHAAI